MKNKQNVLLLSAGRRVGLLQAFQSEISTRGLASYVLTTDLNPKASAACQLSDQAFVMPRVNSDGYIDKLLALCQQQGVGLVIPTIDTELLELSKGRDRFARQGVHLVVSDESLIHTCRDKRLTANFFDSLGIGTPELLERADLTFPCFAKPYDGSRSIGAVKLAHSSDLTDRMRNNPNLIFMEYIDKNFEEYTVDAYFDKEGDLRCLVPRCRLEVRDGEVSKGVTRKNHVYEYMREKLSKIKGARGCLTIQLFAQPQGKRYAALEINPRFGGGYPLAYSSGANYPGWLIDEYLLNKKIDFYDEWESNLLMLRYDAQVLVKNYD